ncbi:MAG: hypothetical protein GY859_11715 [Desulfobacterales bacterium]|nr:hypothetical protein [Desulfobacterales bacterium]
MKSAVRFVMEFSIMEGRASEVKEMIEVLVEKVEAGNPGTLSYEFFFDDQETKVYTLAVFKDSDSFFSHKEIVDETFAKVLEKARLTRAEVFGDPSDQLVRVLEPFSPRVFRHWKGFTR